MSTPAVRKTSRHFPTVSEFENGDFDVEAFDHESHIYVAWKMLESFSTLTVIERYTDALRRLTVSLGIPEKYHETISWFFVLLIDERRQREGRQNWHSFKQENADLFASGLEVMRPYYTQDRLWSEQAKQQFLLPIPDRRQE